MLRSNFCDCSGAYIAVNGRITDGGTNNANKRNKNLALKKNASLKSYVSKIIDLFMDNAGGSWYCYTNV